MLTVGQDGSSGEEPGRPGSGQFLGSPAGLSAAVITRLTEQWQAEQRAAAARDLSAVDYLFALVRAGARFERGILVERHDRAAA